MTEHGTTEGQVNVKYVALVLSKFSGKLKCTFRSVHRYYNSSWKILWFHMMYLFAVFI